MGRNEWGFLVKNDKQLHEIIYLLRDFNRAIIEKDFKEEDIRILGILRHKNNKSTEYYLLCVNHGWGQDAANFLVPRYSGKILLPFEKPIWWAKCQDYVWEWDEENPSVPKLPIE